MDSVELREILTLITLIAENENLRIVVRAGARAAVITGAGALIGALIGGRLGSAAGGALGAWISTCSTENSKSLTAAIREDLTYADKQMLADAVKKILTKVGILLVEVLVGQVVLNGTVKNMIIEVVKAFFNENKGMQLASVSA